MNRALTLMGDTSYVMITFTLYAVIVLKHVLLVENSTVMLVIIYVRSAGNNNAKINKGEVDMSEKLSHEEFVRKAIVSLRKEGYKGIHSVYSGFNTAFKKYFDGENPVEVTNKLAKEGKIIIRPVKGGVMLYLPEEAPASQSLGDEPLKKMGLE